MFFPQILSAQKKNMFSNWESEDGSVFIDLKICQFFVFHVNLRVFCHVLTSLSKGHKQMACIPHSQGSTLRHWFSTCYEPFPRFLDVSYPIGKTGVSFSKRASGMNF